MPVTPYSEPSLQEFVSIKPVPTVSTQVEQGTVIVAPHYDITDLRDAAGNLNPAAKIGDVKISSLNSMWYASTGIGDYEFSVQSVDSARRIDASNMRVFGAVGTNQSLFEITGEKDEVVVRTGTAAFANSGPQISLTDENANWPSIFARNQIPFSTDGSSAASLPNYNKFSLVARVYDGSEQLGEFVVRPFVSTSAPKTLFLLSAPFANSSVFTGDSTTANYSYQLVYKPQFWSVEQAPTVAKVRVVSMNRPALSVGADKVRLKLFRHLNNSAKNVPTVDDGTATLMSVASNNVIVKLTDGTVQNVPLVGGGTTGLRNISSSNVTVDVYYDNPVPTDPLLAVNSAVWHAGTSKLTLTFNNGATRDSLSVADIVDLITAEAPDALDFLEFEAPTSTSVVNTSLWATQDGIIPGTSTPTNINIDGSSVVEFTHYGPDVELTVAALNDLIRIASEPYTPLIYFDENNVSTSLINFDTWRSATGFGASFTLDAPTTLTVPVYTTHVQNTAYELFATKPGSVLESNASGYSVSVTGTQAAITLNGRQGLFMTPAGVVSELFADVNTAMDSDAPVSGSDLYLRSPFKLLLTDEFLNHTSHWRILTPAGLSVASYNLFQVGTAGTSYSNTASFDPSAFVASIDVLSNLLGSLGNRYQLQYRLAYDGAASSVTYENETITITQAVLDTTGYPASWLNLGDLVDALTTDPSFVDANGTGLFDYGNEWNNNGVAENPVQGVDLTAPIYPECFASPTAGYYSSPTASVTVVAPSVNDVNFSGGTFRARVKINPLALFSATSTATASIYIDFRALRLDTTAVTTLTAYGRRPDLVALTRDNYVDILGPVVPNNPAAVAAHEFYRVGGQSALWFLGVDEIDTETDGHQYGTPAAIGRAIDLIVRRTGYNVGVLSYGTEIRNLVLSKITELGGTETLRLIKGMDFWIPLKSPDRYPDVLVESSDYVGTGGIGNYYVYTTSDFSSNEAAAEAVAEGELFLVVASDPNAIDAPYELGDGKRGWKVTELIADGDPSWIEVEGGFNYVGLEEGDGLLFYRRGFGLVTAAGRNMQATAEAIAINESAAASMRLMKILGDTAVRTINGVEYRLPHELVMVGQTLGLLQQLGPTEPCTGLEYFGVRELTGTNDIFTTSQLDLIRGGGVFIPTQEQAGARRTRVSFDVSSDMTNSYTINRCLHVTDDLLSERIRRRIDPLRSARRVDQLLIDEITLQINTEVESVQRKYEAINLVAVAVLTDAQKAKYGIDARRSGLYVQIFKRHPKISSDLILENIIEF